MSTRELVSLEKINALTIYQVFEDAFSDYFVKFEKNPQVHLERWITAGVDFALSYGVKVDGKLGAFILHAHREDFVMNLATGVKKEFQGQGLTALMYEEIRRGLPQKGIRRSQLEVITENARAIRAYEKAGFRKTRKLLCWKGTFSSLTFHGGEHTIRPPVLTGEHTALQVFSPAFEQSAEVIARRSSMLELHELRENGKLLAYAVWNPWQMNLVQLEGADPESLESLLSSMKLSGESAGMINVDERNGRVNGLFPARGLVNFLSQYEMETDF